jgi:hypothetical protein
LLNQTQDIELVVPGEVFIRVTSVDEFSNDVSASLNDSSLNNDMNGEMLLPDVQTSGGDTCGPLTGLPEMNCPPDKYWLPFAAMVSGASNYVLSYITNYSYNYGGADELLATQSKEWSTGSFYSRFNWSTNSTNTAAYHNSTLPVCNPEIDLNGFTANCDPKQNNVIYVPDSTYEDEDEGLVPNPSYTILTRTGTSLDRSFGCYVANCAWSNLPQAYLDTTILDGQTYVATVGSFSGSSIVPGQTYVHYQKFWAWKRNILNTSLDKLNHNGQIGTRFCTVSPAFCAYSVDTTLIHKNLEYKPVIRW